MRKIFGFTWVGVLGLAVQIAACAEGSTLEPNEESGGNAGNGGRGNEGGSGGNQCTTEICDGFDNDCDGATDEGCACTAGETKSCYSGPPSTVDIGSCKAGTHTCDETTKTFGPCTDEVIPMNEICNGLDDDCNGQVDDGLAEVMCGIGACQVVMPGCVSGMPVNCVPGMPAPEVCDGIDNDCNMETDEAYPEKDKPCDTGQMGICGVGENQCLMGMLSCKTINKPTMETCDGNDNDCNGLVDDDIPGFGIPCSTGLPGACSAGTYSCKEGVADCYPDLPSATELCDGLDNNCNGQIDENNAGGGAPCTTTMPGVCTQGKQVCSGGMLVCQPNAQTQAETCNGIDDNCNGQSDEGNPGSGQMCSCGGTTNCSAGKLVCQGCTKEVFCNNGTDDDGDNKTDCQDTDCSLACHTSMGPCAAGESLLMLRSTNVPKSINNLSTVTSTIVFSEALTVKRVVMAVNISHTWDADLLITLKSPAGTVRTMSQNNGGSADNYTNTIFNSNCTTPITSGSAPFSGCFSPEQSMTAYNNQTLKGTWTLSVSDQSPFFDVGTLNAWTLAVCAK